MMVAYFKDVGYSAVTAASIPVTVGVLQVFSRLALAPLANRFGMLRVSACCFAIQGIGLLALPLAGLSIPLTLLCVAAFTVGYGVSVVARPSIVADSFGVLNIATILAWMNLPIALSRAGTPLVASALHDWRFLLLMGVLCLLSAGLLAPIIAKHKKVETPTVPVRSNPVVCAQPSTIN